MRKLVYILSLLLVLIFAVSSLAKMAYGPYHTGVPGGLNLLSVPLDFFMDLIPPRKGGQLVSWGANAFRLSPVFLKRIFFIFLFLMLVARRLYIFIVRTNNPPLAFKKWPYALAAISVMIYFLVASALFVIPFVTRMGGMSFIPVAFALFPAFLFLPIAFLWSEIASLFQAPENLPH